MTSFEESEAKSEKDEGDSDVSEERKPEDFINGDLTPVNLDGNKINQKRPDDVIYVINSAFNDR